MKIVWKLTVVLIVSMYNHADAQNLSLDALAPVGRMIMETMTAVFGPSSDDPEGIRLAEKHNLLQPRIDNSIPFPCPLNEGRSNNRPTSVNFLRPGDIDVIGAIGDSLTAGHGQLATTVLQILGQSRGLSPTAGGQGTWRQFVTLPNMLKEYNPSLVGYALKDAFLNQNESQFNVAEAAALSRNLPFMAKELIRRMRKDPRVNIQTDWKMISLWIGGFDFCTDVCYQEDPESVVEKHRAYLTKALRKLKTHLPRTIVNLIVAPNIRLLRNITETNRPPACVLTLNLCCSCVFSSNFLSKQNLFDKIISGWQQVEAGVADDAEFNTNDFAVVLQPFTTYYSVPLTKEGLTDYSYLSPDCFHFSQKEAARVANSLWNNMMEPVGAKSKAFSELLHFKCPTTDHPYIFTRRNSRR